MSTFSILTVCTGNICRSPLAELFLKTGVAELTEVRVSSVGTGALVGESMPEQAKVLARENALVGYDAHVARQMTIEHLRDADLVIAMSREHRRAVVELMPRRARNTFTLREFARLLTNVGDSEFENIRDLASNQVEQILKEVVEIAASRRGMVPPPDRPDDDDVVDPYRRTDAVYRTALSQIMPATALVIGQFNRAARLARA